MTVADDLRAAADPQPMLQLEAVRQAGQAAADLLDGEPFNKDVFELVGQNLLDQAGLTADGWQFVWDRRKSALGGCFYPLKHIRLSVPFARKNPGTFVDTVLHEIAHAIAGGAAGHGPAWKKVARAVGADPSSTTVVENGLDYLWHGTCPKCGHVGVKRHKLVHRTKFARWRWGCGCGPSHAVWVNQRTGETVDAGAVLADRLRP